jgi:hypothetical protein
MRHHIIAETIQGAPRSLRRPSVHVDIDKICEIQKVKAITGNISILPFPADMPSPQVICTCSYCSKCTITVEGSQQPGSLVSIPTCREHEKKDRRPTLYTLEHPASSRSAPSTPKDPNPRKGARRSQLNNLVI